MAIADLRFRDYRRLGLVALEIADNPTEMQEMLAKMKEALAKGAVPPDPDFVGFSNPPSPFHADVEPAVREFAAKVREEVAKRWGDDYVKDLWYRLTKRE